MGRFISRDPRQGDLFNPQGFNHYSYASNGPTFRSDPSGLADCSVSNPFTWGGCLNNASQAVNNVIIKPAENFINNKVVKPIVNNVVKPLVNNVVVPFVNNVVIPYVKADYDALVASYNTLSNVGSQLWNGYQSFTKTVRDEQQSFYRSVSQDLQGFASDVSRLHITDMNKFLTGVLFCAATVALVVAAIYYLPAAAAAAAGSSVGCLNASLTGPRGSRRACPAPIHAPPPPVRELRLPEKFFGSPALQQPPQISLLRFQVVTLPRIFSILKSHQELEFLQAYSIPQGTSSSKFLFRTNLCPRHT